MAEEINEKEIPTWVKELGEFMVPFRNSHPEACVNLLASDEEGFLSSIGGVEKWAEQLFAALMENPNLIQPTVDACDRVVETIKKTLETSRTSALPIIVNPNQVKS